MFVCVCGCLVFKEIVLIFLLFAKVGIMHGMDLDVKGIFRIGSL